MHEYNNRRTERTISLIVMLMRLEYRVYSQLKNARLVYDVNRFLPNHRTYPQVFVCLTTKVFTMRI